MPRLEIALAAETVTRHYQLDRYLAADVQVTARDGCVDILDIGTIRFKHVITGELIEHKPGPIHSAALREELLARALEEADEIEAEIEAQVRAEKAEAQFEFYRVDREEV